ncbi:LysR family transcriptional regulator [Streptomyces sp. E5N91]|uniref:LysR family transcriptional regulator n=1 Tax=Streptomyces sp. E5N91 TaxID=1851996 RepID=UPI000EF5F53A|nr:LysR family transcriptional regulator [Streptomyces sp. E5N91]
MDVELRQLRCLIAIVDEGTFTDAAIALGVSQAAVSRTLATLEKRLGVRLLRRTSRHTSPTAIGLRVVAHARRVLHEIDNLMHEATSGPAELRIGHHWSALGHLTPTFQHRWREAHPETQLHLLRINSPYAGLIEGTADLAVMRRPLQDRRFETAIVGLETRWCAMAASDPLARRRAVHLADLSNRTLLVDRRTGSTNAELWPPDARPATQESRDIDDWLTVIATGRCVGVTSQSVVDQYPRPGIVYLPVRDAEPVAVRLLWWREDPHPLTRTVLKLLTELYRT